MAQCLEQACLIPSVYTHGPCQDRCRGQSSLCLPSGRGGGGLRLEPLGRVWELLGGVSTMQGSAWP